MQKISGFAVIGGAQRRQVQRGRAGRSSRSCACGCLAGIVTFALLVVFAFVVILPALPGLGARVLGFQPSGESASAFVAAVQPTVQLIDPVQPANVSVDLGSYGEQVVPIAAEQVDVQIGTAADTGQSAAVVRFTEGGLADLCVQRGDNCGIVDPRFRNPRIDLRPGGAIVFVDATIPELGNLSRTVGVVLRVDGTGRAFEVAGIDLDGTLYQLPPGDLGDRVRGFEEVGNDVLNQLALNAGGGRYTLDSVSIDDDSLTLTLR